MIRPSIYLLFFLTTQAQAYSWTDLWLTKNQQA